LNFALWTVQIAAVQFPPNFGIKIYIADCICGFGGYPAGIGDKSALVGSLPDLMKLRNRTGMGDTSDPPQAVIVSGIQEKQLHATIWRSAAKSV
jgi:hypothetical protein